MSEFKRLRKHKWQLPIMDQQTFETLTNNVGKEKFREQLAEYIAHSKHQFNMISYTLVGIYEPLDVMRQAFNQGITACTKTRCMFKNVLYG